MAQPQAYNRETDFTERDGDDTNHPGINIELDAAAQSINEIRNNLALIQRDDGALQNGIVTAESLAPTAFDAFKGDLNQAVADAQTAATSANNAAVSANTARDTAVAAKDTAVTSANAAALNATTATTKAAESSASATASQTSATASANSASASQTSRLASEAARDAAQAAQAAASASQTATATSEANASASAATATAQANIATTQAGIATTQATSAAASATAAAASLDSFDDRYLGSKTADPATDNDGNALLTGALYFNSAASEMRVYTGTAWKATGSAVNGTTNRAKYTATAGQTTFAMTYDVGFVDVYLNGLKLESGVEFTANNGTSVVLATGATAGDVVDMIAFGIFSVANTYTKAEADALLAAKAAQATTYTKTEVDTANALKLNAANPSYTGTLTGGTGVVNFGAGQFYKDASGNVGINTTTPGDYKLYVNGPMAIGTTTFNAIGSIELNSLGTGDRTTYIDFISSGAPGGVDFSSRIIRNAGVNGSLNIEHKGSGRINFLTGDLQRACITSDGWHVIGGSTGGASNETSFTVGQEGAVWSNIASTVNTYHVYSTTTSSYRFYVGENGGVYNFSGNNVNLSDERTKTNIEVAGGYLDKICAIPVKLFNYKDEAEGEQRTLGVIAQDVEAVAPEFVNNNGWEGATAEDGSPLKTVYSNDMMFALMKCIQEQQAMIEQLRAEVAALKAAA